MRTRSLHVLIALLVVASGVPFIATGTGAQGVSEDAFHRVWERTDKPVADLVVSRTWMWGPGPFTPVLQEEYTEGPGGQRDVRYYDKSRMELTDPAADPESVWYVTNGLLVVELISGWMQVGHDDFVERAPADVVVAGDLDDTSGPTYATFTGLSFPGYTASSGVGEAVVQRVNRDGDVTDDPALAGQGVALAYFDEITGHNIAAPFWEFMNSSGTVIEDGQLVTAPLFLDAFYATGRPVIEPYWATVAVAGTPQDVLMQCFERRCLTYTPLNDPGWQVEAGNVGLHYHQWRNDDGPPPGDPAELRINEVMFLPDGDEPEWVELYNASNDPVDIGGMRLTNGSLVNQVTLPGWILPAGSYLVVYFGAGQSDDDFSDGAGSYYAGSAGLPFFSASDIALYGGTPGVDTIVDFVGWGFAGDYDSGAAHDHAVDAGIWPAGAFVEGFGNVPVDEVESHERLHVVGLDESIGRDRESTDTNTPADWDVLGGADALGPTPGTANESAFLDEMNAILSDANVPTGAQLAQAPALPLAQKPWTVMIYMDARSTLSRAMMRELMVIQANGSDANVNVVMLMAGEGASTRMYIQGGAIHHIETDLAPNPGDPAKLATFITWSKTNLPAQRYAMILSGHGRAWKGLFHHGTTGDFLTMSELDEGLAALGQKFDVVKFDACLMANLEVAYQIADRAHYMVASEQTNWGHFPWDRFLTGLKANSAQNGGQVADTLANLHADRYDEFINSPRTKASARARMAAYTWASIDLAVVESELVPAVNTFAAALLADVPVINFHDFRDDNGQLVIKHQGRMPAKEYHDTNFIDLYRFADLISRTLLDSSFLAPPVMQEVSNAVRVMRKGAGDAHANSHGLSIYFPRTLTLPHFAGAPPVTPPHARPDTAIPGSSPGFSNPLFDPRQQLPTRGTHLYKLDASILIPSLRGQPHPMEDDPSFAFPADTVWDEFLHRYYKPVADACIRWQGSCELEVTVPVGTTVTLSGNGSSDSDGPEGPLNDEPAHVGGHEHYYWDFDKDTDHPAPLPDYQPGQQYPVCTEDCDRDEVDDTDDDPDAVGKLVQFTCNAPGEYEIRLMVWDEHHDKSRVRHEDRRHNDGRHWLHFNVDDAWVTVKCEAPPTEPVKKANKSAVGVGEQIEYTISLPASDDGAVNIFIQDELPDTVVFQDFTQCDAGFCNYDPVAHMVTYEGVVEEEEIPEGIAYMVTVPEPPPPEEPPGTPPPEITNCATGMVNDVQFESCVTVEFIEPSG